MGSVGGGTVIKAESGRSPLWCGRLRAWWIAALAAGSARRQERVLRTPTGGKERSRIRRSGASLEGGDGAVEGGAR